MTADPLAPPPARPLWLVTLADLALLLLGFAVLAQASGRATMAQALHERFGAPAAPDVPALPVAAAAVEFARGSVAPRTLAEATGWARGVLADRRTAVTITGAGDTGDVLQATDRAAAVARALAAAGLPATRLQLATTRIPGRRAVLTLAFAGETRSNP